ncbi:hypothetical protein N7462_003479 [Penicillium macrosclerotiorum]|uniref:uncharacterized protein n=1 Tax=Penicillium macrosclerotiorum TaxID=303699 RepID=UPI0025473D56|nr:uncharacterized protein N7462_003479 [Penicillium macrosclerotiorum]KAJ5689087.1 hypothetical protein N7462_003479 [Penicillium macrosclerotiorum]
MVLKAFSRLVITSSGRIPGHTQIAHALGQKSCNIVSIDWLLRSFEKNRALSSKSFWLRPTQSEAENVSPVTKEGDSQQKKRKFTSGVGDEKSSVERAKEMIQANREYLADRVDEGYQGDSKNILGESIICISI